MTNQFASPPQKKKNKKDVIQLQRIVKGEEEKVKWLFTSKRLKRYWNTKTPISGDQILTWCRIAPTLYLKDSDTFCWSWVRETNLSDAEPIPVGWIISCSAKTRTTCLLTQKNVYEKEVWTIHEATEDFAAEASPEAWSGRCGEGGFREDC